jgi:hypothetical protein
MTLMFTPVFGLFAVTAGASTRRIRALTAIVWYVCLAARFMEHL